MKPSRRGFLGSLLGVALAPWKLLKGGEEQHPTTFLVNRCDGKGWVRPHEEHVKAYFEFDAFYGDPADKETTDLWEKHLSDHERLQALIDEAHARNRDYFSGVIDLFDSLDKSFLDPNNAK